MKLPLLLALSTHLTSTTSVATSAEWEKAWCKGSKLSLGMMKPEPLAANFITPVRSPWDGDLRAAFAKWGFREMPGHRDDLCDFGPEQHDIARAFKDLGIETSSAREGGPNQCFHIEHRYGPTVELNKEGKWPEVRDQWYRADGRKLRVCYLYSAKHEHGLTDLLI
jgi:hypothetical protein